ncbi:MAG: glycosyltransferase family 2 protein [Candidatus Pacebacteria bacterium]|nr:glycosyltransferase family 2 protein [Candidatus Paceibacterota bacterium]
MQQGTSKIHCSVGILTFQSGATVGRCLESLKDFDEVMVCDGGSTDETLSLANAYGCKIVPQNKNYKDSSGHLVDFSGVRNQTLEEATYDWFLYIDSDEFVSSLLVDEIRSIVEGGASPALYKLPRKYVVDGVIIECASSYPNYSVRFFHRNVVGKFVKKVHERVEVISGSEVRVLKNCEYVPLPGVSILRDHDKQYLAIESARRTKKVSLTKACVASLFCIKTITRHVLKTIACVFVGRRPRLPFVYEWLKIGYQLCLLRDLWIGVFYKKNI